MKRSEIAKLKYVEESSETDREGESSGDSEEARHERQRQFNLATNYDEDGNCIVEPDPDVEVLSASSGDDELCEDEISRY